MMRGTDGQNREQGQDGPGARPLSAQQAALRREQAEAERAASAPTSRPEAVLRRPLPGESVPAEERAPARRIVRTGHAPGHPAPGARPARPGSATRARRQAKLRAARAAKASASRLKRAERLSNRRRVDWPRALFRVAALLLVAECCVAAGWSPRLWVRQVVVEGNETVAAERIIAADTIAPRTNLFSVPLDELVVRAEADPAIARATASRVFPDTLRVAVEERKPMAVVRFDGTSTCYTIDPELVPFRRLPKREAALPLITASAPPAGGARMGRKMYLSGLSAAAECLPWVLEHKKDFPVEKVSIDPWGKLCLNRVGGLKVRLGSGVELGEKLAALDHLLEKRPDLRGEGASTVAMIDLVAHDAPALVASAEPSPSQSAAHLR